MAATGEPRKRCLYEVLGVPRDCPPEDIRSAYRRLALQLHPDKVAATGAKSPEDATAAFQELLHAYEVLSDPKERAWYDSHRSQILFSDPSSTSKSHRSSFDFDLFAYFSNSAFSGFSDTGKGFYKVYGDLFAKVYAQELWFAKELGLGANAVSPAPLIGNLDSPYSQVTAFYNYWLGFSTVMDFAWVDEYDSSMGANRRSRRIMEEENKKIRRKAKREYNDSVRGLAAFSKKRDKRVVDMMLKRKQEEEERREEERKKKKEEERKKMERARMYQEPEWTKNDEQEDVFDGLESDEDDDKKKKGGEELYCVVCSKKFKSDKQWKNHEQSKKHKDKVAALRMTFQEEDAEISEQQHEEANGEEVRVEFDYEPPVSEGSDSVHEPEGSDSVNELCEEFTDDLELDDNDVKAENAEKEDDVSILEAMLSGRKNRRKGYLGQHESSSNTEHPDYNEETAYFGIQRKGRRKRASRKGTKETELELPKEANNGTQGDAESQNQDFKMKNNEGSSSISVEEISQRNKGSQNMGKNQKSKKQEEDGKEIDLKNRNLSKGRKQKVINNSCDTCGENFETRNKLFAHLGATGHATLKYK